MKPQRIQLSRKKGWRMPANTVKVDRSTRWGNPWSPANTFVTKLESGGAVQSRAATVRECIASYLESIEDHEFGYGRADIRNALHGKNLACWCRLCDQHRDGKPLGVECSECAPCHADVLLGLANDECTNSSTD